MISPKVIVIGWDGATFDIIRPLVEQGRMPVIARFMERGAFGQLESTTPAVTPVAWTTMTTGCNPGKHGIFDGHQLDAATGRIRFANASMRCVPPIWSILSDAGRTAAVLNVPVTYPPDDINGVLIPGMFSPAQARDAIHPADFGHEFEKRFGKHIDSPPKYDDPVRYLKSLLQGIEKRRAMVEYLMDANPWDFMFAVFMETDRVQHFFWEYRDPTHARHAELGNAVERIYMALDAALGTIMAKAGDDTTVAVVSDHGAGPLHTGIFLNRWLLDNELLHLTTPMESSLHPGTSHRLGRLTRKVLATLGIGTADDRADTINNRFRSTIDWDRTLAYSDGMGGSIYFNEEQVDAAKRDALTFAIHNGLLSLKHPHRNEPVIDAIVRREDIYHGPETDNGPDLIVECAPGYQIYAPHEFLLHQTGNPEALFVDHPWCGRHEKYGVFLLHGPAIRPGTDFSVCAMADVAPTLLALMATPIPTHMDGTAVASALRVPIVTAAGQTIAGPSPADTPRSTEESDAAMKKQLKDLGYM
jgi:Uncharacterized conserved protein